MTTALFTLRAKQLNFTLDEIDKLSTGEMFDIFTESANDGAHYDRIASQDDMDRF